MIYNFNMMCIFVGDKFPANTLYLNNTGILFTQKSIGIYTLLAIHFFNDDGIDCVIIFSDVRCESHILLDLKKRSSNKF